MVSPPREHASGRPVFTVSELNRQARVLLEEQFNMVWVRGELSNFRRPGSGHWYFTLKDDAGQVGCAMFVNRNRHARLQPKDGLEVIVRGRVSLYEARGNYQVIVDAMEAAGESALRAAFEALQARLAAEGLFAPERKQDLPVLPRHLAIISSASGAALEDVLAVIRRRYPAMAVTLLPVSVQGAEAEAQIVSAIGRVAETDADVVLLTRGGGSLEDLWAFNLETVARAVAACPLPTVVAIGHETDFTIAEFVADLRAPTPSAAAELITPDRAELIATLRGVEAGLARSMQQRLALAGHALRTQQARLRDPRDRLRQWIQRADDLEGRLVATMRHDCERQRLHLERLRGLLGAHHPSQGVSRLQGEVSGLAARLTPAMRRTTDRASARADGLFRTLRAVSPRALLERGYGIIETPEGAPVTSSGSVVSGDALAVSLSDGTLDVTVDAVRPLDGLLAGEDR